MATAHVGQLVRVPPHGIVARAHMISPLDASGPRQSWSLLNRVSDRAQIQIAAASLQRLYHAGDQLDISPRRVHLICRGRVKHSVPQGIGRTSSIRLLGPGDLMEDFSCLFETAAVQVAALAVTDCEVRSISQRELLEAADSHADLAMALSRQAAQSLRRAEYLVQRRTFGDMTSLCADQVLALAKRFGVHVPGGIFVDHGLSQTEWSHMVGTSRETINKVFSSFVARRWLEVEGRTFVVLAPQEVRRRAGFLDEL